MDEVTVAVVAIAFGLSAVFIPTAFISGITGQFYRQFALTIAASTLISAFNSLTLSPALAAILLKPHGAKKDILTPPAQFPLRLVLQAASTRSSTCTTEFTATCVRWCLRGAAIVLLVYVGLVGLTYFGFKIVPVGFIPAQDKGYLMASIQLPDSASLQRTAGGRSPAPSRSRCTPMASPTPSPSPASRSSSTPTAPTSASMFITLRRIRRTRKTPDLYVTAIQTQLSQQMYEEIQEAQIAVLGAAAGRRHRQRRRF